MKGTTSRRSLEDVADMVEVVGWSGSARKVAIQRMMWNGNYVSTQDMLACFGFVLVCENGCDTLLFV